MKKRKAIIVGVITAECFIILGVLCWKGIHMNNSKSDSQEVKQGVVDKEEEGKEEVIGEAETYTWNEITVTIPEFWRNKYFVDCSKDHFVFYTKESELYLCEFFYDDSATYSPIEASIIAYTDDKLYYIGLPTGDEGIKCTQAEREIYEQMQQDFNAIVESIQIDVPDVRFDQEEYVFPMSSTKLLSEGAISYLDEQRLKIARNEIYARHGRKFHSEELQDHFNSCSWYHGTIDADTFDESILNKIEKKNIKTLEQAEETTKNSR